MNALRLARLREGGLRLATTKTSALLCLASRPTVCLALTRMRKASALKPVYFARSSAYNETVHDLVLQETPIKREVDLGIQERMASIACAIKTPTLKTNRKMSNQVLTATSRLGSEPRCSCTVKGIAQGTAISAAAEGSLPHGRAIVGTQERGVCRRWRSREVETKYPALQGLRLTASD